MTDYKILGQSAPSTNVETDLYTVPNLKSTVVRAINVTNTASASDTFDIALIDNISLVETPTFVAIDGGQNTTGGESNIASTSTNGVTWTQRTLPISARWSTLFYGANIFVAISGAFFNATNISYGFSTIPSAAAATSTDGITWTARTMPSSQPWISVTYGNNTFVAVAYTYPGSAAAATSTDGITWTARTMPSSQLWSSVAYGNNVFVATAGNLDPSTAAASSTDGITWTASTMPLSQRWRGIAYGNNIFVASGRGTAAATSTDGITWTARTMPSNQRWYSVTYGNNTFVAISGLAFHSSAAATSTDGITWTASTLPSSQPWSSVSYGNNTFVAISLNYEITATSTNGVTWTQGTLPAKSNWQSVTYANIEAINYPSTTNADYIFKSHDILANETITIKGGYTLDSNNKIRIKSTNGTSTFHAFGGEI